MFTATNRFRTSGRAVGRHRWLDRHVAMVIRSPHRSPTPSITDSGSHRTESAIRSTGPPFHLLSFSPSLPSLSLLLLSSSNPSDRIEDVVSKATAETSTAASRRSTTSTSSSSSTWVMYVRLTSPLTCSRVIYCRTDRCQTAAATPRLRLGCRGSTLPLRRIVSGRSSISARGGRPVSGVRSGRDRCQRSRARFLVIVLPNCGFRRLPLRRGSSPAIFVFRCSTLQRRSSAAGR